MLGITGPKNKENVYITVSNRTVVRVLVLVYLTFIGFEALRHVAHALVIIFTAFFLALALNSPVQWLAQRIPGKHRGSRTLATAISFFIVVAALAGLLASFVPPIVRQTSSFIDAAPQLVQQVHDENSSVGQLVRRYNLEKQFNDISSQLSDRLKDGTGLAVSTAGKVGSSIFTVLTILALTFMMLIEGPRWMRLGLEVVPAHKRVHVRRLLHDMYQVVKGYVNGQVMLAAIAAGLLLPALIVLHVSYPVALMMVVFVCGLIPLVGHTLGAIIVTTVALFHSVPSAIAILSYYILYQQIENYIIQPRIQANSTNMSPLLVFGSVVIGVNFGGLFGGLVAIPLAGCIRIAVLDYLVNRGVISAAEEEALVEGKHLPKKSPAKAVEN